MAFSKTNLTKYELFSTCTQLQDLEKPLGSGANSITFDRDFKRLIWRLLLLSLRSLKLLTGSLFRLGAALVWVVLTEFFKQVSLCWSVCVHTYTQNVKSCKNRMTKGELRVFIPLSLYQRWHAHTNTQTHMQQADVALTHMVCVTSSVDVLAWKNTCKFTKTELQPSLNSSICWSLLLLSLSHSHSPSYTHIHTHAEYM